MEEEIIESAINIENFAIKSDPIQPHNGEKIDRIIISQYVENESYVVTYSKEDNSVRGWNIDKNGQQPDVYFNLSEIIYNDKGLDTCNDKSTESYYIIDFILHEK